MGDTNIALQALYRLNKTRREQESELDTRKEGRRNEAKAESKQVEAEVMSDLFALCCVRTGASA